MSDKGTSGKADAVNRKVGAAWLPRYSIRQLLIGVTAICVLFGIGIAAYRQYTFEERVIEALSSRGCLGLEESGEPHILKWGGFNFKTPFKNEHNGIYHLEENDIDNINYLGDVTEISFFLTNVNDELVSRLRSRQELKVLHLFGCPVTWEGVQRLPPLPHLEILHVSRGQIPVEMEPAARAKFPGATIRIVEQDAEGNIIVQGTIAAGDREKGNE